MRVFNGILIQYGQLVRSGQWMVLQGNVQDQNPGVIQEGLNSLQIELKVNVLHVELYTKPGNALHQLLFVSNATNQAIFQGYVSLNLLPQVHSTPIGIQGDHGMAEVGVETIEAMDPKNAIFEAEISDTSKPIVDATNSKVDVVKLLQAYRMVPTEGSELKHRRKKVATDEISIVPIQTLGNLT